jgi:uncharacterized repeat protein (TIGR01451 family)
MQIEGLGRWLIHSAFLCLVAGTAAGGINSWTTQGPPGGEHFSDLEASPTDPNLYYVAYNRVLARSTDGAVTWQNIGSEFTNQVLDIAVDPTDGNRIYVAVYQQGLFRSDNGGGSFVQIVPSTDIVWAVGVGGADGRTVYYTAGGGTFHRSLDRGATWTQRTSNPQGINRIFVAGTNGERILAPHGDSLKSSNDGGDTWSTIQVGVNATVWSLQRLSSTSLVAATSTGIYHSTDDAATWTRAIAGTFWSVTRDPITPTTLYAGNSGFWELWRSTNSGMAWTPVGVPMLVEPRGLVATSTGTATRIVAASLQGVVRSTNGGSTWTESASGPVATSPLLATTMAANSRVYAYTVGNGLFSTSMDNGWQRISLAPWHSATTVFGGTQAALAVTPGQPQSIYLVPFMRAGARSTDGGATWTSTGPQLSGLAVSALGADPLDGRIMYASVNLPGGTPLASLYRSTDSGTNWSPHSVDLGAVYPLQIAVDPANTSRIFLASYQGFGPPNSGGLYRSTDGGLHWSERGFIGMDVRRVAIDPSDSNRIYAATQLGLQVSTDGGNTFTRNNPFAIVSPLPAGAVAVDPVVPTTLYAVATDPGYSFGPQQPSLVARSVDRGQTWEVLRASTVSPPWYAGDIVLDPNLPSLMYLVTGTHGVASFEIQNDLSVAIQGHSGTRPFGVDSNFTVRVANNGGLAATAVRLDLTLPNGLTNVGLTPPGGSTCTLTGGAPRCDIPVLRPGQSADITVQYRAPVAMALPVAAQVSAHERDNLGTNDAAQATAVAGEVVDLRVAVTAASTTVDHGDALSYNVRVTNDGPVAASAANFTFTLGSGITLVTAPAECAAASNLLICPLGAMAVGASRDLTIAATASSIGTLSADAAIAAATAASDTNTANNTAAVAVTSRAVADLSVTATDSADPVQAGATFTYTLAVRNGGPDEMPGVTAAITAAGSATAATSTRGTCTIAATAVNCAIGALANGASADITITTSVAAAGTNSLSVTVSGGGTDRSAANNTVQQATVVNAPPAPSPPRSGGGGGGVIDLLMLLALGLLLIHARRRRA